MTINETCRPRIVLITSGDPLADLVCLELLSPTSNMIVSGIVLTKPTFRYRFGLLRKAFLHSSLYYLIYLIFESISPRFIQKKSFLTRLERKRIPTIEVTTLRGGLSADWVRNISPDVVLSVRPGLIFRADFIENVPPLVNLHFARLPEYRGMAGVLRALIARDSELVATAHMIDSEEVDRGNIVAEIYASATPGRSLLYETINLYKMGGKLAEDAVLKVAQGCQGEARSEGDVSSWPSSKLLHELHATGRKLWEVRDFVS